MSRGTRRAIQSPAETLQRASGSCRDLAVLMIAALRSLGFAARFVSGYLRVADDDDSLTGGNTHAWAQVHVPGPGWVDFDPSSGAVGNEDLVRVAVVHDPAAAIPLQGYLVRVCVGSHRNEGGGQGHGRSGGPDRNGGPARDGAIRRERNLSRRSGLRCASTRRVAGWKGLLLEDSCGLRDRL